MAENQDNSALQDSEQGDDFGIPGQDDGASGESAQANSAPAAAPQGSQPPAQAPVAAQQPAASAAAPSGATPDQPKVSGRAMFLGNLLKTILSGVQNAPGNPNNAFDRGFMKNSPQNQQAAKIDLAKGQSEADLAKIQTSMTGMKALQYEYMLKRLPQDQQQAHLNQISDFKQNLIKEGATVEAEGDDEKSSDSQAMHLNSTDPRSTQHAGKFYSLPTMDKDGKPKFDTVYVPNKDTLQNDFKWTDADGKEQTIAAGTPLSGAMGKFVETQNKTAQDQTKAAHKTYVDALSGNIPDAKINETIGFLKDQQKINSPLYQQNKPATDARIESLQAAHQQNISEKAADEQRKGAIAASTAGAKKSDDLVIAGMPGQEETQVMKKGEVPASMTSYALKDPQQLASTVARFNDVQTKVNDLADFVNKGGMEHIQPGLVGDAIAEADKEIKIHAFGSELPTSRVNALLDQENYKAMNQSSRDFVRNYAFAREAMTQLPAIQTFGKSNRINDTQLKAALQLLPDHKMAGNTKAAKDQMEALQKILDPLRKGIPRGLPGASMLPSFMERQQQSQQPLPQDVQSLLQSAK